jgi:hypothetical protein
MGNRSGWRTPYPRRRRPAAARCPLEDADQKRLLQLAPDKPASNAPYGRRRGERLSGCRSGESPYQKPLLDTAASSGEAVEGTASPPVSWGRPGGGLGYPTAPRRPCVQPTLGPLRRSVGRNGSRGGNLERGRAGAHSPRLPPDLPAPAKERREEGPRCRRASFFAMSAVSSRASTSVTRQPLEQSSQRLRAKPRLVLYPARAASIRNEFLDATQRSLRCRRSTLEQSFRL